MYYLENISWKEYTRKTDWKHKPVSHTRLVKLLLDIDKILAAYEDTIFAFDIVKSESVISMKIKFAEKVFEHEIGVHQRVLDESKEGLLFQTVLQEIYILKLEKTFRKQSKEHKELQLRNKHVKQFFRSILGGE